MKIAVQSLATAACLLWVAALSLGQSRPSALGVLVEPRPPLEVPPELRVILPPRATVRILANTELTNDGEVVLVYEAEPGSEPDSHIAVVRAGRIVKEFRVAELRKYGEAFTVVAFSQIRLNVMENGVVIVFRNIGDGAGTLFVVVNHQSDSYALVFEQLLRQGQLRIFEGETTQIEMWSAREDLDEGISCTWCAHRYEIQTLKWQDGNFIPENKRLTRKPLNPHRISERLLVVAVEENPR